MSKLKIRQIFRTARPYSSTDENIDGFANHFYTTQTAGHNHVLLDSGINPVRSIIAPDGVRLPAILIRSAPNKAGSADTPWRDTFDIDNGHIHYFGDNKDPSLSPALKKGNKALLSLYESHRSTDRSLRMAAAPLIFYRSVSVNRKHKGFLEFNGFGIIRDIRLVSQYDRSRDATFTNFAFNFLVLSMANENEYFNWDWISARRDGSLKLDETHKLAPQSWQDWVKLGSGATEKLRRRVSRSNLQSSKDQKPSVGSREYNTLREIYEFYEGRKARFEGLAAVICAKVLNTSGASYTRGWVTSSTSDGGADFYGRLDIGDGFGRAKLIVLGQAKCESLSTPTGGNHIARTVARLKRGWVGVYVTTSYFSESVQQEVLEDAYPIVLINGLKLAETVIKTIHEEGISSLSKYLDEIDSMYEEMLASRKPEELLIE